MHCDCTVTTVRHLLRMLAEDGMAQTSIPLTTFGTSLVAPCMPGLPAEQPWPAFDDFCFGSEMLFHSNACPGF